MTTSSNALLVAENCRILGDTLAAETIEALEAENTRLVLWHHTLVTDYKVLRLKLDEMRAILAECDRLMDGAISSEVTISQSE